MKINRENYEHYFIDLLDGILSVEVVDELLDFLRENPDLAEELNGLEKIKIEDVETSTFNHQHLLKSDFDQADIFEETCIRSIEKELSTEKELEFQDYLTNHSKAAKTYQLFQATIVKPDTNISYPHKKQLLRRRKISPYWYAAAAVLLLGVLFWFNQPQTTPKFSIAQQILPLENTTTPTTEVFVPKNNIVQIKGEPKPAEAEEIQQTNVEYRQEIAAIVPLKTMPALASNIEFNSSSAALMPMQVNEKLRNLPEIYPTVGELLAEEVNKIKPIEEAEKLGMAALTKLNDVSDNKFRFSTNAAGKLNKIQFNSKLLAFSIPIKADQN